MMMQAGDCLSDERTDARTMRNIRRLVDSFRCPDCDSRSIVHTDPSHSWIVITWHDSTCPNSNADGFTVVEA